MWGFWEGYVAFSETDEHGVLQKLIGEVALLEVDTAHVQLDFHCSLDIEHRDIFEGDIREVVDLV